MHWSHLRLIFFSVIVATSCIWCLHKEADSCSQFWNNGFQDIFSPWEQTFLFLYLPCYLFIQTPQCTKFHKSLRSSMHLKSSSTLFCNLLLLGELKTDSRSFKHMPDFKHKPFSGSQGTTERYKYLCECSEDSGLVASCLEVQRHYLLTWQGYTGTYSWAFAINSLTSVKWLML